MVDREINKSINNQMKYPERIEPFPDCIEFKNMHKVFYLTFFIAPLWVECLVNAQIRSRARDSGKRKSYNANIRALEERHI